MLRPLSKPARNRLAVALAGVLLAGCGASAEPASQEKAAGEKTDVTVEPIKATRELTDANGVRISLPEEPRRIVCLFALCDDILTELGIVPTATNSLLLAHEDFLGKEKAAQVEVVPGGFIAPEVEAILSHDPDLVIGLEDTHGKLAPALEGATTFWAMQPETWQDSVGYLRDVAALTGRTAEGEKAEKAFRTKLAAAERARSDRTALVIYGSDENFGVATPEGDVAASLFPKIADYPWKSRGVEGSYSLEEILARDVDVLFVETMSFGEPDGRLSEKLAENPLWGKIPAVRNGDVHEVDSEVWAKGRGTRSLGIVLDEATAALR
ncbi:ABC transporter substrate-binding protein [Streptomyces griseomycini]|uniref:Iron complex transport system substrate-binding protein n=1 Tax=Streptomyces griseomycini TaxID=66895 RepID=A0A7W7PQU8_9ACTN|nr:ABC transporter substrate-binding protein [Streptomyces griseomycini]MBB4898939.1 iron complex transport system substrate-binding protein [Streptomyces griseomycini]GGQ07167.1 iron siderophore-binding protein [Streptomyces griseomycini]GGR22391.1 iron siderophore-binding protein [Streptomyces griseomycini]